MSSKLAALTLRLWTRLNAQVRLPYALRRYLPVLPVAGAQLRDLNRQVAEAVAGISSNFERMVERAQGAIAEASRLVGAGKAPFDQQTGVEGLLAAARASVEQLLTRIVADGEVCTGLIAKMETLQRDMAEVTHAVRDVERISLANTILALNARIEAAHLGDLGQGFEIVAQELWHQAKSSDAITEGIRDTVVRLCRDATCVETAIQGLACADQSGIASVRKSVTGTLSAIEQQHGEMKASLSEVASRSQEVAEEVQSAVVSLQFQDRVSQRIEHLVEALESMHAALSGAAEEALEPVHEETTTGAAERLAGTYTMQSERVVHAAAVGAPAVEDHEGDVELF